MISESTKIARQAFELADAGKDNEAIALYRQALSDADPDHTDLWQIRGGFACVLERSGDLNAAREQRELAIDAALRQASSEDSLTVASARYFLGELLLKMQEPEQALATVRASMCASSMESVLRTVEAIACWRTGAVAEARVSAMRAIECARSDQQRERIAERLHEIQYND